MNAPASLAANGFASPETGNPIVALIVGSADAQEAQLGALAALRDSGLGLALLLVEPGSPQAIADARRFLEDLCPRGAVLGPSASAGEGFAALCREMNCPYVVIAPNAQSEPDRLVCSNDRLGAKDATEYLITLGHKRIGFIAGPDHCRASRERELGHIDALAEHGLDLGAELAASGDGTFDAGIEAGNLMLSVSPRPTAIFASNDMMAAGVLSAAHERGIVVPEALSVLGFGDSMLAQASWPLLTSMRMPSAEMAFTAAIKLINPQHAGAQPLEFFCELVIRRSTAPPPSERKP
jgi:LacI family transcriptional regulator